MSSSLADYVRGSWRILVKEVAAFGAVGAVGFLIDFGLFNAFFHDGQIIAKTISTTVATVVTYVGNRYLSFSHRARSKLSREASFFFLINLITLLASLVVIGIFSYPLHFKHHIFVMNMVNLLTIAMGTVFRFWAYKRFVFLHPDRVAARIPDSVIEDERSLAAAAGAGQPAGTGAGIGQDAGTGQDVPAKGDGRTAATGGDGRTAATGGDGRTAATGGDGRTAATGGDPIVRAG